MKDKGKSKKMSKGYLKKQNKGPLQNHDVFLEFISTTYRCTHIMLAQILDKEVKHIFMNNFSIVNV